MPTYCDCQRSPEEDEHPWPEMIQLHLCPPNHYYLCPECGMIREDVCLPGGFITRTQRHPSHADPDLPALVRELAQAILDQPHAEQLPLF